MFQIRYFNELKNPKNKYIYYQIFRLGHNVSVSSYLSFSVSLHNIQHLGIISLKMVDINILIIREKISITNVNFNNY